MKVSGLFLDLDGTMIDSWNGWAQKTYAAYDEISHIIGMSRDELIDMSVQALGDEGFDFRRKLTNFRKLFSFCEDRPDLKKIVDKYEAQQYGQDPLYSGIKDLIARARHSGAKVIVYTDGPWWYAANKLSAAGIKPQDLDLVAVQGDTSPHPLKLAARERAARYPMLELSASILSKLQQAKLPNGRTNKPCPDIMHLLIDRMKLDPATCLMVGDHLCDAQTTALAGRWGMDSVDGYNGGDVPFAWAAYGAKIDPENLDLYRRISPNTDYILGPEIVKQAFIDHSIKPEIVLDNPRQLQELVTFEPPKARANSRRFKGPVPQIRP